MLPFLRPKTEKDLGEKLFGKLKKFRLARNGASVTVAGRLLSLYRHEAEPDGLMPPQAGRVELLALFQTRAGRCLVYYVVSYPETEDIAGRQEYVHVCADLDAMREFLGAMHYPNRWQFAEAALVQAARTLGVEKGGAASVDRRAAGAPVVSDVPDGSAQADATGETGPSASGRRASERAADGPATPPTPGS